MNVPDVPDYVYGFKGLMGMMYRPDGSPAGIMSDMIGNPSWWDDLTLELRSPLYTTTKWPKDAKVKATCEHLATAERYLKKAEDELLYLKGMYGPNGAYGVKHPQIPPTTGVGRYAHNPYMSLSWTSTSTYAPSHINPYETHNTVTYNGTYWVRNDHMGHGYYGNNPVEVADEVVQSLRRNHKNIVDSHKEIVPSQHCSCGLYASHNGHAFEYVKEARRCGLLAIVRAWGTIQEYDRGFRAEYMSIDKMLVLHHPDFSLDRAFGSALHRARERVYRELCELLGPENVAFADNEVIHNLVYHTKYPHNVEAIQTLFKERKDGNRELPTDDHRRAIEREQARERAEYEAYLRASRITRHPEGDARPGRGPDRMTNTRRASVRPANIPASVPRMGQYSKTWKDMVVSSNRSRYWGY